jgi:hypothetical protein
MAVKPIYIYRWKFKFSDYDYQALVHCKINGEELYVPVSAVRLPINKVSYTTPPQFKYAAEIESVNWGTLLYYYNFSQVLFDRYIQDVDWDYKIVLPPAERQIRPETYWDNPLLANETGDDEVMPLDETYTFHRPLISILKLVRDKKVHTVDVYNDVTKEDKWRPRQLKRLRPTVKVKAS